MKANTSYEEQNLICSYLQLLLVDRIFHRDLQVLTNHPLLRTPVLYIEVLSSGMERVTLLLSEIQMEFARKDIRITNIKSNKEGLWADAKIRGQEMRVVFPLSQYKNELYSRMRVYLGGMNHEI
ncbi:hypothetical protein J45TS6_18610 [Paenibacillus sp. J45TS6]|uniref:hypothetical protein n=1 Tax=Paenibacillus sp. J45TS6 TaxID=2807196 RepID=UPI001B0FEBB9|nr:hypothetical protein [Paenibacillus sp. J45TS6]GIP43402.1 hypothetical protein J45TS6_18610 [Paenibacillus sp. J45TS6]